MTGDPIGKKPKWHIREKPMAEFGGLNNAVKEIKGFRTHPGLRSNFQVHGRRFEQTIAAVRAGFVNYCEAKNHGDAVDVLGDRRRTFNQSIDQANGALRDLMSHTGQLESAVVMARDRVLAALAVLEAAVNAPQE